MNGYMGKILKIDLTLTGNIAILDQPVITRSGAADMEWVQQIFWDLVKDKAIRRI